MNSVIRLNHQKEFENLEDVRVTVQTLMQKIKCTECERKMSENERRENRELKLKLKQLKPKIWGVCLEKGSKRQRNDKKMDELFDTAKELGEQVDGLMEVHSK